MRDGVVQYVDVGLLGYDGDWGEAQVVAADEFDFLLAAREINVAEGAFFTLPAWAECADNLHADELGDAVGQFFDRGGSRGMVNPAGTHT